MATSKREASRMHDADHGRGTGRARVRAALLDFLPAELTPTPFALGDLFAAYLDEYTEFIVGPGRDPVGFMTRGEDSNFTARARVALEHLGMPAAALAHHQALARWFEHRRAFMKFEWHRTDRGVEPLAAVYFRRRPVIADVIERLAGWGVDASARELLATVAGIMEKRTVHFVAAAFRPGRPLHHKLYFSQYATPDTRARVHERIGRIFELFGCPSELRERWRAHHEHCVRGGESTLFLSVSMSSAGMEPSFKIDYPHVPVAQAAAWLGNDPQVKADASAACALAGTRALSFLGVRFAGDRPAPALKYYCDVPGKPTG